MITNNGKKQHLSVIAGKAYSFADKFVLGASEAVMPESATDLDFTWGSFDITDSVIDEQLQQVVFYGTIPAELAGEIKEIGMLTLDSALIDSGQPINRTFFFGSEEGWKPMDEEEFTYTNKDSKMGPENITWEDIAIGQAIKLDDININISDMNLFKSKILAENETTIEISFYSSDVEKASKEFILQDGENFLKTEFAGFDKTSGFDSYSIKAILLKIISGSGNLDLDCLILSNTNNGGLVMREVLPNPIQKQSGSSMEIEMAVMLSV